MKNTLTLVLAALSCLCTGCFLPKLTVSPHLASYELSGDVAAVTDSGSISASDQASLSDLGLGDSETSVGVRADFQWLGAHLSVSTLDSSFSGSGQAETDITLDGQTITTGTDVHSSLDVNSVFAAMTWDLPIPVVDVGFGLGAMQLDLDMNVNPAGDDSVGTSVSEVIPLVVGRVGFGLGAFDVGATVGFLSVDVGDLHGSITDLDLAASYGILGGDEHLRGAVMVGYRSFSIQSDYDDGDSKVDVDFEVAGPYVGVSVSF